MQRRQFLAVTSIGPLAAHSAFSADPERREVDIAIIGAGLAGLTAAHELRERKLQACVIEARDRVGGRTLDHPIGGGHVVEGGGQWIGSSQTAVRELASKLGIETYRSYMQGKTILAVSGVHLTIDSNERESRDLRKVKERLNAMAKEVPLADPWNARNAKVWDEITVADWLKTNAKEADTREQIGLELETALGSPAHTSLLWFLFYVHSAGSVEALDVEAQEMRFKGGPQAISKRLAADLGSDLLLSSPVKRIDYTDDRVAIDSERERVIAKRVVVAMMPADADRIEFAPALPAKRSELMKKWKGEPGFKVNAVYAKPFWRDAGLSGLGLSDRGAVGVTFDNSPPDASRGVLVAFINAAKAPKDVLARRRAILEELGALFGKAAKAPINYFETDWSKENWTAGCVSPLPPGVLIRLGAALREPVGRIHWAGTETSEIWCGYMDGAVRSGKRVAQEVQRAL